MASDQFLSLLIQRMRFLQTGEKLRIYNYCSLNGSLPDRDLLISIAGRGRASSFNKGKYVRKAENDISFLVKSGIKIVSILDKEYPTLLKEIYNPPFLLYYRGILPDNKRGSISMVGTRKATGLALRRTYSLSFELAGADISIISGLASGIDSEAHKGAVDGSGYTAGILGCGVENVYPASNRKLAFSILDHGGALIGEYPPGTVPESFNFPERNRIVSGLSKATVVVEAPEQSGSLITADFALEQGRDLFVMDIIPESGVNSGCRALIDQGAPVVESASEVLSLLSCTNKTRVKRIIIDKGFDSSQTGDFLAKRMLGEIQREEVSREGDYYRL